MTPRRPLIATEYGRSSPWGLARLGRRFLNLLVASVAIVATLPLMLIIAVLVKLDSRGPVLYRQPRVGVDRRRRQNFGSENGRRHEDRGGQVFMILKFRTMRTDAQSGQVWAARNDARVTKVGRFLRATRLDELPQLFLVLKGDMNVVGPRPEQPTIFARLRSELPSYRKRQRVLPGITGLAQVNRGYDESLDDVRQKVEFDLEYIEGASVLRDFAIMVRTMPVMIRGLWDQSGEEEVGVEPRGVPASAPDPGRHGSPGRAPHFSSREWWRGRPRIKSTSRPPLDLARWSRHGEGEGVGQPLGQIE